MNCTEQITIDKLRHMKESEDHVEFKSARHNYPYNGGKHTDPRDRRHCVLGYIVALANERGGLMVLGMCKTKCLMMSAVPTLLRAMSDSWKMLSMRRSEYE